MGRTGNNHPLLRLYANSVDTKKARVATLVHYRQLLRRSSYCPLYAYWESLEGARYQDCHVAWRHGTVYLSPKRDWVESLASQRL